MKLDKLIVCCISAAAISGFAAPVVKVEKAGAEKVTVSLKIAEDPSNPAYTKCLKRNLELSGWFKVGPSGTIVVSGTVGGTISATGRGKTISSPAAASDAPGKRMAARRFSDAMVEAFSDGGKGFATTRLTYVGRKGTDNAELFMCYPDGWDMRQLTEDGHAVVGPRWAPNGRHIYYVGFHEAKPWVYRLDTEDNSYKNRIRLAPFKNGATGVAISPDGRTAALILSYEGNPELYTMDLTQPKRVVVRMTTTPAAAESSPCWSPDGRKIAYVSDQTRNPQIYICDVASRKSTRFTSRGRQNTHPDWLSDGKICWASLQEGQWCVMVSDPNGGESTARRVTEPGTWQDPSWAADGRHFVASRDGSLFLVDTAPDGDKPVQLFFNKGNWMNPALSK